MKIVQSFWTKPLFHGPQLRSKDRLSGGWPNNLVHLTSWALSCYQLRQFYDEVELITDQAGKEILIDKLKLPYTNVIVELDKLNNFGSDLWALGKIYSYSVQTKPFIHIDGDVFIWARFSQILESANLVCQNFDINLIQYKQALDKIKQLDFYIPDEIRNDAVGGNIISCNAGILGGNNISFFKKYADSSFAFVDKNMRHLKSEDFPTFNILFEQYLFYCLAKDQEIKIESFFQEMDYGEIPYHYVRFGTTPFKTKYNHVIAGFKRHETISEKVCMMLRVNYPEAFHRVKNVIDNLQI